MIFLKYYKWVQFYFLFAVILLTTSVQAQTIEVVTEEWPPYNYTQQGKVLGTSTDILREALESTGFSYSIRSFPWARAYEMAKTRSNTLIYTIVRTAQRENTFKWVAEIQPPEPTFLYKKADNEHVIVTSLEEAKAFAVVAVRSAYTEQKLKELGFSEDQNLILTGDPFLATRMLMSGRADLYAEAASNLPSILEKEKVSEKSLKPAVFVMENKFFAAFSLETDDAVVERLRQGIEKITARDGTLEPKYSYIGQ